MAEFLAKKGYHFMYRPFGEFGLASVQVFTQNFNIERNAKLIELEVRIRPWFGLKCKLYAS